LGLESESNSPGLERVVYENNQISVNLIFVNIVNANLITGLHDCAQSAVNELIKQRRVLTLQRWILAKDGCLAKIGWQNN